jgi:integrase
VLKTYAPLRASRPLPQGQGSFFLANRDGTPLASSTIQAAFDNLRRTVGIHGATGARQSPRLHDLRHSFAVHRLTDWYRQGADVQRLLPVLSTYLGHTDLAGTQVYLSMTPELLQQASSRFERYASGGIYA